MRSPIWAGIVLSRRSPATQVVGYRSLAGARSLASQSAAQFWAGFVAPFATNPTQIDGVTSAAVGFTRAELERFRDATVPDLIGPGLRLLFVGINPGLWTAATSTHFAHPGNRFYPALLRAGIIDRPIDRGVGMTDEDRQYLTSRGIGITNLVARATPRAAELVAAELRAGGQQLVRFVTEHHPTVVAIAGVTAYREAFGEPKAILGRQPEPIDGSELWVVPNPSGLNAHETIDTLAVAYREVAVAAGIL